MSNVRHNIVWGGDEPPAGAVKKAYDELLAPMANDFDIDIHIHVCHGKKELVPEMDFDKFYIFAMMAPDILNCDRGKIQELTLGDKKLKIDGGQSDILNITSKIPDGIDIIKDGNDVTIAIVYEASIYFLTDFCHCKNKEQLDRSIATFKYVIDHATKTDELFRALKSGAEEKGKRALQHALSKQFKDRLKKEESALSSAQGLYEKYTVNLTDAQRKIIATQAIITAIQDNIGSIPIALDKKWNSTKKLEGTKMYESISFQRSCVIGTTTPIYIEENKQWYFLGNFKVALSFDGTIKIHSLFNDRGVTQDHPHVNAGNPCWGNLNGEPQKRIAESEFDVAFVEIYTFLCHYSREGGPYAKIDLWPKVTKKQMDDAKEKYEQKAVDTEIKVEQQEMTIA